MFGLIHVFDGLYIFFPRLYKCTVFNLRSTTLSMVHPDIKYSFGENPRDLQNNNPYFKRDLYLELFLLTKLSTIREVEKYLFIVTPPRSLTFKFTGCKITHYTMESYPPVSSMECFFSYVVF